MKSTRFSRPRGHFGTALTFSMPFALVGLAAGLWLGHPLWGVALLAFGVATRLALSIAVGRLVVQDPSWFNLLVLYPIRDLMGFCFWAASYPSRRICGASASLSSPGEECARRGNPPASLRVVFPANPCSITRSQHSTDVSGTGIIFTATGPNLAGFCFSGQGGSSASIHGVPTR